jgi:type VI secretion system secreted protein Hcp
MAVDCYLKLDGISGESADDKHKDEIQVLSWSYGGSQVTSVAGTGGSGAGKVNLSDLSIMKYYDKASVPMLQAMCKGDHIKTGVLTAIKAGAGGDPFLKISFEELYITSLQSSASSEIPTESVTFSYNKVKIEYFTQNEVGALQKANSVSYDLKKNVVAQ